MSDEPIWRDETDDGKEGILLSEPDLLIERARFVGSFPYEPPVAKSSDGREPGQYGPRDRAIDDRALLYMLTSAKSIRNAASLQDWAEWAASYPEVGMTSEEADRRGNPHAAVRCHFTFEGVMRLLELAGAPQSMCKDFELLLRRQRPKASEKRAKVQAEILKNPHRSLREVAKEAGYDPGELSRDLKKRRVLWPGRVLGQG